MRMFTFLKANLLLLAFGLLPFSVKGAAQPWEKAYEASEATGDDVIAFWHFDAGAPLEDSSSHGHSLILRNTDAAIVEEGRFGGALQVSEVEQEDIRQGASTPATDTLSPEGPFTLELWFAPGEGFGAAPIAFLLDKKYYYSGQNPSKTHSDYSLLLRKSGAQYVIEGQLGFGDASEDLRSAPQSFEQGEWHHVAMSYDGEGGAKLYLDGALVGEKQFEGKAAIRKGRFPLVIGDRIGSKGARFLGKIDEVRISRRTLSFAPGERVTLRRSGARSAFGRMEEEAFLDFEVSNATSDLLKGATLTLDAPGQPLSASVPDVPAGEVAGFKVKLDTRLRPGSYTWNAQLKDAHGDSLGKPLPVSVTIVPRALPNTMPVVMWGSTENVELLKEIGFTHSFVFTTRSTNPLEPDYVAHTRLRLDNLYANQLNGAVNITTAQLEDVRQRFNRVDRSGKPYSKANTDGLLPGAAELLRKTGADVAGAFSDLPAYQGTRINTEARDATRLSFHSVDREAYKKASGDEIPPEVAEPRGIAYQQLAQFPTDRIVADDHPILRYYRWFWKEGDGWNGLSSAAVDGIKSSSPTRNWTWCDPAVRVPSIYGSGGHVDYLNQWTYTYPDPLKIALACEQSFAMARGQPGQGVMAMTQIIWYRTRTAPTGKGPLRKGGWEEKEPEARFITIAPDHLSEALWLKLSYPVGGIMYHGWQSLTGEYSATKRDAYRFTNPEARERLTHLIHTVVQPLGPTLTQVGAKRSDVAFLESFTSQIFAGRGNYGWGTGWGGDSWLIASYAGLQPHVIYEEELEKKELEGFKVLIMPHCDVLTQRTAEIVRAFQKRGGIVIADEFLAPGLDPDILLSYVKRKGKPDEDKALLLSSAAALRAELAPFHSDDIRGSSPDMIVRRRQAGKGDYLFVINDKRTYGDYVGLYGKVMEKGEPLKGDVTLTRDGGHIYDLLAQKEVPARSIGGGLQFPVDLGPGDGRLFLVLDEAMGTPTVEIPSEAGRGGRLPCTIALRDAKGKPVDAVIPVEVSLLDPQGRKAEGSGPYGVREGRLELHFDIAPNDQPGEWKLEVREGASGQKVVRSFTVKA